MGVVFDLCLLFTRVSFKLSNTEHRSSQRDVVINYVYPCREDLGPKSTEKKRRPSLDLSRDFNASSLGERAVFFFIIVKNTNFGVGHKVGHRVGHP